MLDAQGVMQVLCRTMARNQPARLLDLLSHLDWNVRRIPDNINDRYFCIKPCQGPLCILLVELLVQQCRCHREGKLYPVGYWKLLSHDIRLADFNDAFERLTDHVEQIAQPHTFFVAIYGRRFMKMRRWICRQSAVNRAAVVDVAALGIRHEKSYPRFVNVRCSAREIVADTIVADNNVDVGGFPKIVVAKGSELRMIVGNRSGETFRFTRKAG